MIEDVANYNQVANRVAWLEEQIADLKSKVAELEEKIKNIKV